MAVSENRKVFVLDLQRGQLVCEFENDESKYKLGVMANILAAFGLKNELLFLKCNLKKSIRIQIEFQDHPNQLLILFSTLKRFELERL